MSGIKNFSYVAISRLRDGSHAVSTMILVSSGTNVVGHRMSGKWFGDSYGLALLHAQRVAAATGFEVVDRTAELTAERSNGRAAR